MIYTLFITGDIHFAIIPKSSKPKDILKKQADVEEFEKDANLAWHSRTGKDGYIYLMLCSNAYLNKDIDDLRGDLERIVKLTHYPEHMEEGMTAYTLFSSYDIRIRSGMIIFHDK